MIRYKRPDHIHISVPPEGLQEALAFYNDVLGLQRIARPDEVFGDSGYWFALTSIELHIGVEAVMPPSIRHFAMEVEDVKSARTYLEAQGVKTQDQSKLPGRDRFSFVDPFGNRIELLEYLH